MLAHLHHRVRHNQSCPRGDRRVCTCAVDQTLVLCIMYIKHSKRLVHPRGGKGITFLQELQYNWDGLRVTQQGLMARCSRSTVCHLAHRHVWFRPHLTATCRHYGHETSPSLTPKGRGRLARQLAPSTLSTCYEPCSKAIACSTLVASVVQSCKRSCKRCLRCLGLSQAALRLCAASCHTCANAALASSKSRPA